MELTITPNFAQERALNMLRRDWKANDTFMVYSPTGSGKTGLAAFIVAGFVSRGMRVLFCAPYTILISQTANRFVEYGLPGDEIGYIYPDIEIDISSACNLKITNETFHKSILLISGCVIYIDKQLEN